MSYGDGRQALIEAAVRVIGDHGWGGLTNRKVAALARVDNTLITHHFGSREGLLAAAADWAVATSIEQANLALAGRLSDSFADSLLALVHLDPTIQAFQIELILAARREPHLREVVTRLYDSYLASANALIQNTYDLPADPDLARAVFASVEGLVLQVLTVVPQESVRRSLAALDRLIVGYRTSATTGSHAG